MTDRLRPNWYPDGPYLPSPCIHCRQMLKHTGATSGTTWIPVATPPDGRPRDWWTCWSNEGRPGGGAYGGHEPWQAVPDTEHSDPTAPPPFFHHRSPEEGT